METTKPKRRGRGETAPRRFAQNIVVDEVTGCWLWQGKLNHEGYSQMGWISKYDGSHGGSGHRFSYERFVGPIPEGHQIDHLCRVRHCVCPGHLEAVTGRENLLRGNTFQARNAAKTHCDNGHLFDNKNTHVRSDGSRTCRTCVRENAQRYRNEAGGDPYWQAVKQDPVKLEAVREYKREWARAKRGSVQQRARSRRYA